MKKLFLVFTIIIFFGSCQKSELINEIEYKEPPILDFTGNDILNVEEFKVVLNADDLKSNESGVWAIQSGLYDNKVFFEDSNKPKTTFHGLPGEEYKLIWKVKNSENTTTTIFTISFAPLKTEILNLSPDFYKTRLHLQAKSYDRGYWSIEGKYHHIWNLNFGGTIIPDLYSTNILFYGFENTNYKLTWTTWYGSKSASITIPFTSGIYQQDEALEDLNASQYKKNSSGNVTELDMSGEGKAYIFERLDEFPSLQSLIHLRKLDLQGDGLTEFPEVILSKYLNLEFLNIGHNAISSLPENIGNLTKLDTLIMNNNNDNKKLTRLPESFGKLKNLRYLDLVFMGIKTLPESLSNLKNLSYLDLSLNHITKLTENIGNLSNLESLRAEVTTNIPNSFANLTNLKECYLIIATDSPAVLPDNFGNLKKLKILNISGDFNKIPESFSNLINLVKLDLLGGSTLGQLPDNFGNLVNLEQVRIVANLIVLPNSFTNLKKLKELTINGSLEYLPSNIGNLKKLEWLDISSLNLKEIPESFGNLENLKFFRAYLNKITTIPESFGNLKNIYEINLSYNSISHFPSTMANLSETLYKLEIRGNNYSEEELSLLKKLLPATVISSY